MSQIIEDVEVDSQTIVPYPALACAIKATFFDSHSLMHSTSETFTTYATSQLSYSFSLMTKITLNKRQFSLKSKLLKHQTPFMITSSEIKKNLYRSFLKCSYDNSFKALVNEQGEILFRLHSFISSKVNLHHSKEIPKVCLFVEKTYMKSLKLFQGAFQSILPLIEPQFQKRIVQHVQKIQRLQILKNNCMFMSYDPLNGQDEQEIKDYTVEGGQLDSIVIYESKTQNSRAGDKKKYLFFSSLWKNSSNLQRIEQDNIFQKFCPTRIRQIFKSSLRVMETKSIKNKNEIDMILTQIHMLDQKKIQWSHFHEGGFGILKKAVVNFFQMIEDEKTKGKKRNSHSIPANKMLVLKADKTKSGRMSRIFVEKEILKKIQNKSSRFIPLFYYSEQTINDFSDYLLMQYYPFKSLESWLKTYGQFASLFTKLSLLCFICYGVKFLHENKIIHRDLKLANILVQAKLSIKIIDFGQSYHPDVQSLIEKSKKKFRPGFTLPYAPPQAFFRQERVPTEAYDIFSIGVIIFQVVFSRNLLGDMSVSQQKKIFIQQACGLSQNEEEEITNFHNIVRHKVFMVHEMLCDLGPLQIMTPLINLVDQCLHPVPEKRPCLNWVIAVLKETYGILLDFYSI